MMDRAQQPDPFEAPPHSGHETSDVSIRGVAIFALGLALLVIFSLMAVYGLLTLLSERRVGADIAPSPLATRKIPPEPRLQVNPAVDLKEMRAAENEILSSYGWVDRESGIVRIPIDRAKKLLVEKGLPERPERSPVPSPAGK